MQLYVNYPLSEQGTTLDCVIVEHKPFAVCRIKARDFYLIACVNYTDPARPMIIGTDPDPRTAWCRRLAMLLQAAWMAGIRHHKDSLDQSPMLQGY